jgi:hypothetical protein
MNENKTNEIDIKKQMDSNVKGFILTANQFNHLATFFNEYSMEKYGTWKLEFRHKSGHIIHQRHMKNYVYPCVALSSDFPYFRMEFNGRFCEDWVKFNKIARKSNAEFIVFKNDHNNNISSFSMCGGTSYMEMTTWFGGGRLYHEPSATPYTLSTFDNVIN